MPLSVEDISGAYNGGMAKKPSQRPSHFVKEWRKHRKLTQEQLAEQIGSTSGAISQLENGIINYTQPTLEALAKALKCRAGDILLGAPDPDTPQSPEGRLRSALLAFGVDAKHLSRAVAAIQAGFVRVEEPPEPSDSHGQPQHANRRRESEPSK